MKAEVIGQVFGHSDGIMLGAVAQGLLEGGVLDVLAENDGPHLLSTLADGLVPGFMMIALETLADQGLCQMADDADGNLFLTMTGEGRQWLGIRNAYKGYAAHLSAARVMSDHLMEDENSGDENSKARAHLRAPYVTAVMSSISRKGWDGFLECLPGPDHLSARVLIDQGWAKHHGANLTLTRQGEVAVSLASQYDYPMCYFPLLQSIPGLLAGTGDKTGGVDRELDIEFSGQVFRGPCRDLFLRQALPLFDRVDISAQPKYIIDTGCGDGTVLVETFKAIKEMTRRGQALAQAPLLMIGVEYEAVAANRAREILTSSAVPHLVISGNIADPEAIAEALAKEGIDARDALHISKSVIHNRTFIAPEGASGISGVARMATQDAFHVDPDGNPVSPAALFKNLTDFFSSWSPWIRRHGMIAIEAHCWPSSLCATAIGRYPMTMLKTTHGFSGQFLVGSDFYQTAANSAGLIALASNNIFGAAELPPTMTIKHFLPKDALALAGLL